MKRFLIVLPIAFCTKVAHAERWLTLATEWPLFDASIDPASLRVDGKYRHVRLKVALLRPAVAAAHPELRLPEDNMRDIEISDFRVNCQGGSYLSGQSIVHRLDGAQRQGTDTGSSVALNGLGDDLVKRICALDEPRATQPLSKTKPTSTRQDPAYADVASAWRTGNTSTMWYVMDLAQPKIFSNGTQVSSMRMLGEFNCTEQEYRTQMTIGMTGHLGQGNIVDASKKVEDWIAVGVDGSGSDLMAAACDKP